MVMATIVLEKVLILGGQSQWTAIPEYKLRLRISRSTGKHQWRQNRGGQGGHGKSAHFGPQFLPVISVCTQLVNKFLL